jgi:integrase
MLREQEQGMLATGPQLEVRLQAGTSWEDHDLVFCTKRGKLLDPTYMLVTFKKLLQNVGLPRMRFHDLRHSAATLLLAMGVHVKVVQELLGHSNITMTLNTYSHVLPSMQQDAMSKMSDLFNRPDNQGDLGKRPDGDGQATSR